MKPNASSGIRCRRAPAPTHRPVLLLEEVSHETPDLGSEQQTGLSQNMFSFFVGKFINIETCMVVYP